MRIEHDLSGGACPAAFGYKEQIWAYLDSESGLLQMGVRYYAPSLGRFLTRDPSGFTAGANLYAFCMGNPIDFFDANGCWPDELTKLLHTATAEETH